MRPRMMVLAQSRSRTYQRPAHTHLDIECGAQSYLYLKDVLCREMAERGRTVVLEDG